MMTKSAENTSLEIKRFINAPRVRVFEAWIDPAQLKQWFGPERVRTREIVAEAKVGGKFRWDLTDCDGKEKTIAGEYREIDLEKKIVFTWRHLDDEAWEDRMSIVTVEFSDRDGGTELRLKHEQLPSEASRNDHNEGWKSLLDRLEKFVSK
jgi:glutathione S-transferase